MKIKTLEEFVKETQETFNNCNGGCNLDEYTKEIIINEKCKVKGKRGICRREMITMIMFCEFFSSFEGCTWKKSKPLKK